VSLLQVFKPLFVVAIFGVANPAQSHNVFYAVGKLTATHATGFDVVNVYGLTSTAFTRDKIAAVIAEMFKIYGRVFLHRTKFCRFYLTFFKKLFRKFAQYKFIHYICSTMTHEMEGHEAQRLFSQGEHSGLNPYNQGSAEHDQWETGWQWAIEMEVRRLNEEWELHEAFKNNLEK
jgi:hypothetical protein